MCQKQSRVNYEVKKVIETNNVSVLLNLNITDFASTVKL